MLCRFVMKATQAIGWLTSLLPWRFSSWDTGGALAHVVWTAMRNPMLADAFPLLNMYCLSTGGTRILSCHWAVNVTNKKSHKIYLTIYIKLKEYFLWVLWYSQVWIIETAYTFQNLTFCKLHMQMIVNVEQTEVRGPKGCAWMMRELSSKGMAGYRSMELFITIP